MNIEEKIDFLRKRHPAFGRKVMHDVNDKGEEFCEIIYPNENNPLMPIAVSVSDEGCLISVGKIPNVTGDYPIHVEQAAEAIDDIVSDRIVFVLGYGDGNDGEGAPFMTEIFPITGYDDDKSDELEKFIAKISTPISGFKRKLTRLKGRFVITDFSGSKSQTITR
jgi:hypothetical protein